jgi:hypothetical protein
MPLNPPSPCGPWGPSQQTVCVLQLALTGQHDLGWQNWLLGQHDLDIQKESLEDLVH